MKSWKLILALFLLFVFIFVTVVLGGQNLHQWFGGDGNIIKFYTYILFVIIVLYIVWRQREGRMYIPTADKIKLPNNRTFLGSYQCGGKIIEFFSPCDKEEFIDDFYIIAQEVTQKTRTKPAPEIPEDFGIIGD